MQEDFHYYATYCAAFLAGYTPEESREIAYSAQLVDCCSKTFIRKYKGPLTAATTQLQTELADTHTNIPGIQDITRIWASFHFLPGNLYAVLKRRPRVYMDKYRLICDVNGPLVRDTVILANKGGTEACGIAMHILADTWAHRYFAGTPSFVINDAREFFELRETENGIERIKVRFNHNPISPDSLEKNKFTNCLKQDGELSTMNLGHGRAGHLPDYSCMVYEFQPAWGDYMIIRKDNPSDYYRAFCQMVYAMGFLRGEFTEFETDRYDEEKVQPYRDEIMSILKKRQLIANEDWKSFGEMLTGTALEDFDLQKYGGEYMASAREEKEHTFLGRFFTAAIAQKSMVTNKIYSSGNRIAGFSVEQDPGGLKGMAKFGMAAYGQGRGGAS